jgi:hypothetical protein
MSRLGPLVLLCLNGVHRDSFTFTSLRAPRAFILIMYFVHVMLYVLCVIVTKPNFVP